MLSIRRKLTYWYVGTTSAVLLFFIGADIVGLRHKMTEEAWIEEIWEHFMLALGMVLMVSFVGSWVIRRAFSPVKRMARTARNISADDLSLRVDALGDQDEIGELARTFNEMISRLENSFQRIRRFSADVAHELGTPLSVLRGELELALRKERSAETYRDTLEHLLQEVGQLSSIVENLMFLSQVDSKNVPPLTSGVAFDDTVMRAYEEVLPFAQARGVRMDLERIDETSLHGNDLLLRRMVVNLLDNSVKFTPENGAVRVSLECDSGRFRLAISDTGIGIPEPDRAHLFDRFYRVEKSRSKRTGGTGLGLAIVKEIAALHGLDVEVESRLHEGTEVSVSGTTAPKSR